MKTKNSGFTASGFARPEIRPGDIFRDKYGSTVMIKGVSERRIIGGKNMLSLLSHLAIRKINILNYIGFTCEKWDDTGTTLGHFGTTSRHFGTTRIFT
ncbi:DUF4222 domain-containing protein [Escherichia coli]|uniref:DUF4222 domain-containing protein n=1 Tax=Escherichia coli TaxID=562 RepID=UPI0020363F68|nr:DUF4222 domain-containing protein [Escherichia coli]